MAALVGLVDLVVLGDAMVRRALVDPDALVALPRLVRTPGGGRGTRRRVVRPARRGLAHGDEAAPAPALAGLPEPQVNLKIRDEDGEVLRKYDLSYPAVRVAVEYNGKVHVLTPGRGRQTSSGAVPSTTTAGGSCP